MIPQTPARLPPASWRGAWTTAESNSHSSLTARIASGRAYGCSPTTRDTADGSTRRQLSTTAKRWAASRRDWPATAEWNSASSPATANASCRDRGCSRRGVLRRIGCAAARSRFPSGGNEASRSSLRQRLSVARHRDHVAPLEQPLAVNLDDDVLVAQQHRRH